MIEKIMTREKIDSILKDVVDNFEYTPDPMRYDVADCWRVMKEKPYKGDCEDFSLTVLYNLSNRSYWKMFWYLLTGRAKIHYVTINDAGHAVLRWELYYTDNITKKWVARYQMDDLGFRFQSSSFWIHHVIYRLFIRRKLDI